MDMNMGMPKKQHMNEFILSRLIHETFPRN